MKIDRWDVEVWAAKSRNGEVCGVFGCQNKPEVKCDHCSNMYCEEHACVLNTPGHQAKEPDREEFQHAGYKCLIQRHYELGHLCGYVGVKKRHPCYGKNDDRMPYDDLFPVHVHGGLTFSDEGDGSWHPKGYWWLGFDCAHAWDIVPYIQVLTAPTQYEQHGTYRNFQYVRQETKAFAEQVATLEFIDWEFTWVWPFLLPARVARRIWSKRRKVSV